MTIKDIEIVENKDLPKFKKFKERQDIFIPNILPSVPNRNGFVWLVSGSAGSGKTNLVLNFFKNKALYRNKFSNIYYFVPMVSFTSLAKNPLAELDSIYHELSVENLQEVYNDLNAKKIEYVESVLKKKDKKEKVFVDEESEDDIKEKEKEELEYSVVIIDDFADELKQNDIQKFLKKFLIKTRHLCVAFIFLIQSYYLYPKQLRKMITNISIFKPQNVEEWNSLCKEIVNLNQEDANKLFDFIYNEPYTHLDIDTIRNIYYKNFNQLNLIK